MRSKNETMSDGIFDRLIFLDFDGVLHPASRAPGEALPFCWVPELAEELAPYPHVGLVIHSSWTERFTLDDMREFLFPLGSRLLGVVGSGTKSQSILAFLRDQPAISSWLVIDDEPAQFGDEFSESLLVCDPRTGLSDVALRGRLREWLARGDRDGVDMFSDLTLEEFAAASGLTAEQVVEAKRNGEVFSCRLGDEPFDRYPAYQLRGEIRGQPLKALITAFGSDGSSSMYMFMRSAGDLLGGVSPAEVLCGGTASEVRLSEGVAEFLARDHFDRFQGVLQAAASWLAARRP